MKKIIAINAGPRIGWNTDQLVMQACKGAKSKGYEVKKIDLYRIGKVTGCISCFGCKKEGSKGVCVLKDPIGEILAEIREADGLIIGSPNYLGDLTSAFRALYERLIFQSLTYNKENPNCNNHFIPVLLITTSNCSKEMYEAIGYDKMLNNYKGTFNNFVGPTSLLISGNTLQVNDYSQFDWTMFDGNAKKQYHDEHFHEDLQKAYQLGTELF